MPEKNNEMPQLFFAFENRRWLVEIDCHELIFDN